MAQVSETGPNVVNHDEKGNGDAPKPFLAEAPPQGLKTRDLKTRDLQTLRTRALFVAASQGPRFSTPAFTMLRRLPQGEEPALFGLRFGFTATRKIGNAVERNRIRRRLRGALRVVLPRLPQALPALDLVILARRTTIDHPFADLLADLERAILVLSGRDKSGQPKRGAARR